MMAIIEVLDSVNFFGQIVYGYWVGYIKYKKIQCNSFMVKILKNKIQSREFLITIFLYIPFCSIFAILV